MPATKIYEAPQSTCSKGVRYGGVIIEFLDEVFRSGELIPENPVRRALLSEQYRILGKPEGAKPDRIRVRKSRRHS